jgi:lipoate-protein ligase A
VPHDADWTYSLTVPPAHPWYALRAPQSYERMHRWIQQAFARLGVATELAPCCRKEIPGQCFAGYEQYDVLLRGRKIAGAAQRRTKDGLLIQGSVQPPPRDLAREAWEQAMRETATHDWQVQWEELAPPPALEKLAQDLVRAKYEHDAFNRRR